MDHLLRVFNGAPREKGSLKQALLWMADERACCCLITVNTEAGYLVARRVLEPYNVDPGRGDAQVTREPLIPALGWRIAAV